MDSWEYNIFIANVVDVDRVTNINYGKVLGAALSPGAMAVEMRPDISRMWQLRGPDGLTDWDRLQKMGREGWEAVSCVPLQFNGYTLQVIWTFKRRIQPEA
jgi:hypothetical protein